MLGCDRRHGLPDAVAVRMSAIGAVLALWHEDLITLNADRLRYAVERDSMTWRLCLSMRESVQHQVPPVSDGSGASVTHMTRRQCFGRY